MSKIPKTILLASSNQGKLRELTIIAKEYNIDILNPSELKTEKSRPDVDENANTFLANARLKTDAFFDWSKMPTLADDSGLEVESLGGFPGVRSARWAGEGLNDKQRCRKLLEKMSEEKVGVEPQDRLARFRCALVLKTDAKTYFQSEGISRGHILTEPRGMGGFGYDSIVEIEELKKTFAEVDFSVTLEKGFRAKAARSLFENLKNGTPYSD